MMKQLRNEKGLTLVELLATFVIGAMIISLIIGINVSVQKQYRQQKDDIAYFLDVTTGAKAITKDLRKAEEVELDAANASAIKLVWHDDTGTELIREYDLDGKLVTRDGGGYISDIDVFTFEEIEDNGLISVAFTIKGESGKSIETKIIKR